MRPEHPSSARLRTIILGLAAALLIDAILWRLGLPDFLAYGIAGGLVVCFIVVGLDRLHSVERRLDERDTTRNKPPREPDH